MYVCIHLLYVVEYGQIQLLQFLLTTNTEAQFTYQALVTVTLNL